MMRNKILSLLRKILLEFQTKGEWPKFDLPEIEVEYPQEEKYGDYSSNIVMKIAPLVNKNPLEIGELIIKKLSQDSRNKNFFEKIELVPPGFLNFYLTKNWLNRQVNLILKAGKNYGQSHLGKNQKVQVEFISANPTGPLHLGNGRGGFIGDTLANLLKFAGYKVQREYYINDLGKQIDLLGESVTRRYLQLQGIKIDYPEDLYQGEYIKELAQKLKLRDYKLNYKNKIKEIRERIKTLAFREMVSQIKKLVGSKLKIKYHQWFSEKSLYDEGGVDKILEFLKQENLVYKKEGALWFKTNQFGDDKDRVLIKADGEQTYFLSDIAYHWNKFAKRKFQKVIDIWGADHQGYVGRMQAITKALGFEGQLEIIIVQLVRLMSKGKEVKMSKRKGTFVTLEELVDQVGLDVARFFFLMCKPGTHMDFDLDLARKRSQKNPVYYVQYAYTRICSIIRKARKRGLKIQKSTGFTQREEFDLIRRLIKFPEMIKAISQNYEVHRLPFQALEIAESFHNFYTQCKVIDRERVNLNRFKLIQATQIVLKNSLSLMGISAPEKM